MVSDIVKIGDKIDIRIVEQIVRAEKTGETPHTYKSQVLDVMDNGDFEIAMPFEGTKIILLPLELRYEFLFITSGGMYKANGHVKERYKSENRFMLRIALNTSLQKFQRREFYRLPCGLDVSFWEITEEQANFAEIGDIFSAIRDDDFYVRQRKGHTLDLSGGGVKMISAVPCEGEDPHYLLMSIMLKSEEREEQVDITGKVLTCTRIVQDSDIHYEYRIAFIVKDKKVTEAIVRYIFAEERKNRKTGKGL